MHVSTHTCILCGSEASSFFTDKKQKTYCHCPNCDGIFLSPAYFLKKSEEKQRYDEHNNDIYDKRYQSFVSDIIAEIVKNERKLSTGLDFGCGPGAVIQHVLINQGYHIYTYDPFYQPNKEVLNKTYHYLVSCEVIEHFFNPLQSFRQMYNLLNSKGRLYLKTDVLYNRSVDFFKSWGYRHDPTHVFFYTPKTLAFLKEEIGFSTLMLKGRTIVFEK